MVYLKVVNAQAFKDSNAGLLDVQGATQICFGQAVNSPHLSKRVESGFKGTVQPNYKIPYFIVTLKGVCGQGNTCFYLTGHCH